MFKRNRFIFLLFILVSCTKVETGLNISITGFVRLIQEDGKEQFNRDSASVSVKESTIISQTDSNGKFTINDLIAGKTYSVRIEKEGYGIATHTGIQLVGDQEPGFIGIINLYQYPSIQLSSATLSYAYQSIQINGVISESDDFLAMCYLNDSEDVNESHYDLTSGIHSMVWNETHLSVSVPINNTYIPGTKLYVAVYFYNPNEPSSYDYNTHLYYYTSGKKAGVFNITL